MWALAQSWLFLLQSSSVLMTCEMQQKMIAVFGAPATKVGNPNEAAGSSLAQPWLTAICRMNQWMEELSLPPSPFASVSFSVILSKEMSKCYFFLKKHLPHHAALGIQRTYLNTKTGGQQTPKKHSMIVQQGKMCISCIWLHTCNRTFSS